MVAWLALEMEEGTPPGTGTITHPTPTTLPHHIYSLASPLKFSFICCLFISLGDSIYLYYPSILNLISKLGNEVKRSWTDSLQS